MCLRARKCGDAGKEVMCEMVALWWQSFRRLAHRGKDGSHFPTLLARYAARHVRAGRRLCGQEARGILSPAGRQRHGLAVRTLPDDKTLFHKTGLGETLPHVLSDKSRTAPP